MVCVNEIEQGEASWYGPRFNGKPTASGEIFNDEDFTAAHPDLPFGTFVRVVNLNNGHSVLVRINDRGNFAHFRAIDLSYGAAMALNMIDDGVADVSIIECRR
jgi:rare lipoprotein A